MPVRQLSVYDFLADFVPGVAALLGFGALASLLGVDVPTDIGVAAGVAFVVVAYLAGRIVHALAGQDEVKLFRELFDHLVRSIEESRAELGALRDRQRITGEPSVPDRLAPSEDASSLEFDDVVESTVAVDASTRGPGHVPETGDRTELYGQFRRFGFSVLHGESTLYQRYNILETFYRNLWLVSAYFALVFVVVAVLSGAGVLTDLSLSWIVGGTALGALLVAIGSELVLRVLADESEWDWSYSIQHGFWIATLFVVACLPIVALYVTSEPVAESDVWKRAIVAGPGLLALSLVFDVRRVQFKDRQVRAFVNDMYLNRSEWVRQRDESAESERA